MDDPAGGNTQVQKGAATVAGIWFSSTTNGDVALIGAQGAQAGAVEHLSSATAIDAIALSGYNAAPGPQHDDYNQFFVVDGKLFANSKGFGDQVNVSTDNGKTFKSSQSSTTGVPNAGLIWLSHDSGGTYHLVDDIGNVWKSSTAPGSGTTWTRTWQPEATPPDPDPVPAADCQHSFHQGYFAFDAQQVFWASPDGKTLVYEDIDNAGVCVSTDGGGNFLPVAFPNPPAASASHPPYVVLFTSATHGITAYGNELDTAGSAYAYFTDDAGQHWTAATLPAGLAGTQYAITNGFAAPDGQHVWLGGFTHDSTLMLMKSADGGKTWKDVSTSLNATVKQAFYKLHTGFALDANNIWVGGDYGGLLYSPTGGE